MSLTHFSANLPDPLWWTHPHPHPHPHPNYPIMDSSPKASLFSTVVDHHHPPTTPTSTSTSAFNFTSATAADQDIHSKEPMFEKPLTPSDVGKLNRLVIPKQHAEKYFPLAANADSVDQQKGLLLCFEDETGKPWRFRYSYWNSSQSYVLTKGWSRYVKDKRLDAGDVVLFERHRYDGDRLFIGWRRRPSSSAAAAPPVQDCTSTAGGSGGQINGWTTTAARMFYDAQYNYPSHHHLPLSLPHPYQPDCLHAGGGINENMEIKNNQSSGNVPRSVRLFGVNLECPDESEPSTPDSSSQQGGAQPQLQPHYQYYSNSNHNMNINFSQMRYHQHQG